MSPDKLIQRLSNHRNFFEAEFKAISNDEAYWTPSPGQWSVHFVACHLLDEEIDDFRARLKSTVDNPKALWPDTNPQDWVESRNYAGRDYQDTVARFLAERDASLSWLKSIPVAAWQHVNVHPVGGAMRADTLLANWVGHDLLHFRQLLRLAWLRTEASLESGSLSYAGEW